MADLTSEIIQVDVGSGQRKYYIHKDILCASSPFFAKACNGNWKEARERRIELPEDEPECFDKYVQWLYFNELFVEERKNDCEALRWGDWLDAYLLGDKLLDQKFKDACFDIVYNQYENGGTLSPSDQAKLLYENLPESDPYLRLYVYVSAYWTTLDDFDPEVSADAANAPMEFFRDVAKALVQIRDMADSSNLEATKLTRSDFYRGVHSSTTS
ncbi:hypothetical protein DIS24_g5050 [Lasiodiplodia hormozganensis]|uniref:BTB domain-containing protein n=1 Tax=Lasiodiplodia hormozganensis TaxID=869390 RepID=A0AA40CXW0_9PEZI|nr:hypothetical protein DIS24_g5050 [Lasiodiplodia hormozganensis]